MGSAAALAVAGCCFAWADQTPDPGPLAIAEFQKRVSDYVALRKKAEAGLGRPKSSNSQKAIAGRTQELARKIRAARLNARAGEIFTPLAAAEFRRLIGITMQGKDSAEIRASLKSAEPVALHLRVNDPYPSTIPLQSTPPSLLVNLPQLPKEVDYRVVGHTLMLRDVEANLILDYITDVVI